MVNKQFKGPIRPGESKEIFRETGITQREFRGPVMPGGDEATFRRLGTGSVSPTFRASLKREAAQREAAERIRLAQEAKIELERRTIARQQVVEQQRQQLLLREVRSKSITPGTLRKGETIDIPKTGREKVSGVAREFLTGETGKSFIGFGTTPLGIQTGRPLVTAEKTKEVISKRAGLTGKVIGEFIPTTPLDVAVLGGTAAILTKAPPIARAGSGLVFGVIGTKQALDPGVAIEKRIAGGIIGGLGFAGAGLETSPFIKGTFARLSPKFRGLKKAQPVPKGKLFPKGEAEIIKQVSTLTPEEAIDIRLIPSGRGFGFTQAEQQAFIGKRGTITTSARDLVKGTVGDVKVGEGEAGLGLFFTPSVEKVGLARASRLGLSDLFKVPKGDLKIGFKQEKPQIVFLRDVPITKVGRPGTARGVGFPSSELEVTLLPGTKITGARVGKTVLKGQLVDIFEAQITRGGKLTKTPKVSIPGLSTAQTGNFISIPTVSTAIGTRAVLTKVKVPVSLPPSSVVAPRISARIDRKITRDISKIIGPSPAVPGKISIPQRKIDRDIKSLISPGRVRRAVARITSTEIIPRKKRRSILLPDIKLGIIPIRKRKKLKPKSRLVFTEGFISRQLTTLEKGLQTRVITNVEKESKQLEEGAGLFKRLAAPIIK